MKFLSGSCRIPVPYIPIVSRSSLKNSVCPIYISISLEQIIWIIWVIYSYSVTSHLSTQFSQLVWKTSWSATPILSLCATSWCFYSINGPKQHILETFFLISSLCFSHYFSLLLLHHLSQCYFEIWFWSSKIGGFVILRGHPAGWVGWVVLVGHQNSRRRHAGGPSTSSEISLMTRQMCIASRQETRYEQCVLSPSDGMQFCSTIISA